MEFLDVRTDFAFKKVFGSEQSKPILLDFLNAVINFDGERITDLEIVDPYQIPLVKGMKDSFVDVKAMLSNRTRVIIEMQVLNYTGLEKRILYNAAKSYSTQLVRGEEYNTLSGPWIPSGQPGKFSTRVVIDNCPPGSCPSSTNGCRLARAV